MPRTCCPRDGVRPCADAWNEAIRRHTAATTEWTPEALAELARLRELWRAAAYYCYYRPTSCY